MTTADLITQEINRLGDLEQLRVLEFAKALAHRPVGRKIEDLQELVGTFSTADLDQMQKAIEEDCEQIDVEGW